MTDYTARNVLLKDANGNYLIPYTEKADLSLSNLNATGKAYVAIKGYDSNTTYSLNEVVMTVVSGSVLFYKSLANNNTSVLSDTTKWEGLEFGGAVDIDGNTITLNSSDEIQTVGVIDNRSGSALKVWTGTRSQYDSILNKDANTLYNITDDTGEFASFATTSLNNITNAGENVIFNIAKTTAIPGSVMIWAGTTVPEGYLLCDGSAVSRTTYSALFSAIGTTYGPGDSSSTFNLPNGYTLLYTTPYLDVITANGDRTYLNLGYSGGGIYYTNLGYSNDTAVKASPSAALGQFGLPTNLYANTNNFIQLKFIIKY